VALSTEWKEKVSVSAIEAVAHTWGRPPELGAPNGALPGAPAQR